MHINHATLSVLFEGYQALFRQAFNAADNVNEWRQLCRIVKSRTSSELYPFLKPLPGMREFEGERVKQNIESGKYTVENRKFELTIALDRDKIADDQHGIYSTVVEDMASAAARQPNELIYELLKQGESALGYDEVAFFSASHPENGSTASNLASGGGAGWYLMDLGKSQKPFIFQEREPLEFTALVNPEDPRVFALDQYEMGMRVRNAAGFGPWQLAFKSLDTLDATNFDSAMASMMSRVNDSGKSLGIRPTHLIVPPSLRASARALIAAERNAAGASNTNFGAVELIVSPQLL
jgi:phage major head subunit gpT-like protein